MNFNNNNNNYKDNRENKNNDLINNKSNTQLLKNGFFTGGLAYAISKSIICPLEISQCWIPSTLNHVPVLSYMVLIATGIQPLVKHFGYQILWTENLFEIIKFSPINGIRFGIYSIYKNHNLKGIINSDVNNNSKMKNINNNNNKLKILSSYLISGGQAGIVTSLLTHPINYYNCYVYHQYLILQEYKNHDKIIYKNKFNYYKYQIKDFIKFYQKERLYSAFSYSIIPNFINSSIFFGGYDIGKSIFLNEGNYKDGGGENIDNNKNIKRFSIAFMVNIITHFVSFPFETINNTMLIQSIFCKIDKVEKNKKEFFSSSFDCFKKIIRLEGFKSLFEGAIKSPIFHFSTNSRPSILRIPCGTLLLFFIDIIHDYIK